MSKDELTTQPYTDADAKGAVTAFDVGLGNVDNKALANVEFSDLQATRYTDSEAKSAVSASDVGLSDVENKALSQASFADLAASPGDVSKSDVGLGNVDNKALANVQFSDLQATRYTDSEAKSAVSASDVGLGNVPNEDATNPANLDQAGASNGQALVYQNGWQPGSVGGAYTELLVGENGNQISNIDFVTPIKNTNFEHYKLILTNLRWDGVSPATIRFTRDGGSSFDNSDNYLYSIHLGSDTVETTQSPSTDRIYLSEETIKDRPGVFNIDIYGVHTSSGFVSLVWDGRVDRLSTQVGAVNGAGIYKRDGVNGLRLTGFRDITFIRYALFGAFDLSDA